jgi:hypothetical protein
MSAVSPWTKLPRRNIWVHSRGYVVERVVRGCWDAYLPSHDLSPGEVPDYRRAVWSSPRHKNRDAAMSTVTMEIRRVDRALREALGGAA